MFFLPKAAFPQPFLPGQSYFGTNNYIEYRAGNLPIIISAPHGGYLVPASIPDRSCPNCVVIADAFTQETVMQLDTVIRQYLGGYPHIIINKLARKKLDANREIVEAALGNPAAELAWAEYHAYIQTAKDSLIAQYGTALYIDLHGHGHTIQRLEIGYLLNKTTLQMSDAALDAGNFQNQTGIRHLLNVLNPGASFAAVMRGPLSLGGMYANYNFSAVPSPAIPAPANSEPYFIGGYDIRRHGSRDSSSLNAIQIELNRIGLRDSWEGRQAFAKASACIFRDFVDTWLFPWDTLSPGQVVTTTADMGAGSLRAIVGAAHAGDTIRFAPALQGDSIRLASAIVPCTNLVIAGPGQDLLTISGMSQTRLFEVSAHLEIAISGLSLADGQSPIGEDGGAILNAGLLRLSHCRLTGNFADDDGGALANLDSATAWLDTCEISHNACGDDGGALRNPLGNLYLKACAVTDNFSPSFGGGISNGHLLGAFYCTFSGNQATGSGGGIRTFGGTTRLEHSTLYGNSAGSRGGAVSMTASVQLKYCTLLRNSAGNGGGGLRVINGNCSLHNTIVAENTGGTEPDISHSNGSVLSLGYNLVGDTTGSDWQPGAGDLLGNAGTLVISGTDTLANNGGSTWTAALLPGSIAIGAGDSAGAPATDQRGFPRIIGSNIDIGAYEYDPGVGLEDIPAIDIVILYPNPMQDKAILRIPKEMEGPFLVRICNTQGQILWQKETFGLREIELLRRQLPSGMYFVVVKGTNQRFTLPLLMN